MDESPSYKVGLENVFVSYGTTEQGTRHNRVTFYLPDAVPLSLRFATDEQFEQWKTRLSVFPQYDAESYALRNCQGVFREESGHGSPKAPSYHRKYLITEECLVVPDTEILSLMKVLMQRAMMVPEIILYVRVRASIDGRSRACCTMAP